MARKSAKIATFSDKMAAYGKESLTEAQQVRIAKNKYLISREADILQAHAEGYTNGLIAKVATMELLESGIQKHFTVKNKEGEEVERETIIGTREIKKICEPEE